MLQCELRTRLSWAFCTYVHHELRLSAVDQYASQRGLMRVDLELPFTHQVGGRERKQMVVFDTGGVNLFFFVIMSFTRCLDDIDLCPFVIASCAAARRHLALRHERQLQAEHEDDLEHPPRPKCGERRAGQGAHTVPDRLQGGDAEAELPCGHRGDRL